MQNFDDLNSSKVDLKIQNSHTFLKGITLIPQETLDIKIDHDRNL